MGVGGGGLHSHFNGCVVVEVVTINILCLNFFSVRLDCFKVHVFL